MQQRKGLRAAQGKRCGRQMKSHNEQGLRRELEALDTHQLNLLLQREAEKPVSQIDEALVRSAWMTLEQREVEPLPVDPTVEVACAKYRAGCPKSFGGKARMWIHLCVIAAALCLILTAIPRASGESLLVEFFQKVRSDVVAFFKPSQTDNRHIPNGIIEHPGLEELRQTVENCGVTVPVVPTWIPEEYELIELKADYFPSKTRIVANFETSNQTIVFYYDIYTHSVTHEFHKDETEYIEYESAGIIHKIYTNNGKQFALWDRDNVKCSIVVDCQEENLIMILDSIYNMEDQ